MLPEVLGQVQIFYVSPHQTLPLQLVTSGSKVMGLWGISLQAFPPPLPSLLGNVDVEDFLIQQVQQPR